MWWKKFKNKESPEFMRSMIEDVNGTVVECNTAYEGKRNTTKEHWETMKLHGWCDVAKVRKLCV